jgi:predicted RecA/RadA family phage recombinase
MATNRIFEDGRYLYLSVGSGVESGDAVLVGSIPGVAQYDADSDDSAVVDTAGVYDLAVTANNTSDSGSAISVGQKLYYDDGSGSLDAGELTPDTSNGTFFGYALEAVSSGQDATIKVKIGY